MQPAADRPPRVLVADAIGENRGSLIDALTSSGISCAEAIDGLCAWRKFQTDRPDLVLAALRLPGISGLELLTRVREVSMTPFLVQVPSGELAAAVSAIRSGAADVIPLPCDTHDLPDRVRAAIARNPERSSCGSAAGAFAGRSVASARVREQITALAGLRIPVLFRGEKGTGRDHAAHCLAAADGIQLGNVVRICPTDGSRGTRSESGKTVYLDDVDQHPKVEQAYWSARIRESEASRENAPRRILASTSCDLEALSRSEEFEINLANCLTRFTIDIPPLRDRLEDIAPLVGTLGRRVASRIGRPRVAFTPPAVKALQEQAWPGNITQLAGVIEKLVALSVDGIITRKCVQQILSETPSGVNSMRVLEERRRRDELVATLDATGGNLAEAARRLSMSRGAVIYRAQKFGLLAKRT